MNYKLFIQKVIVLVFILLNLVALLNYCIDPLMMFSHSNSLNNKQTDFNERQQKTNYLYFNDTRYSNVMLGSSRTTYLNQYDFFYNTFNYAANGMSPYEYKKFIEYFIEINQKEPEIIILGIDFFGTAVERNKKFDNQDYLKNTKSSLYRYKNLYNANLAEYSVKNIRQNIKIKKPYYSRTNIKLTPPHYMIENEEKIRNSLVKFEKYEYDIFLKDYYEDLRNKFKNSKFIIFTTPITINQIVEYEKNGLLNRYFQWLAELIEVFGEVNHFAYPNEITNNLSYFFDAGHALPTVSSHIGNFIKNDESRLNNFGIKLNKSNFKDFVENYKKEKNDKL